MSLNAFSLTTYGSRVHDARGLVGCFDLKLPHHASPVVSIIVPIHGQLDYTLKCLKAIELNSEDESYEIIVVDDKSDWSVFQALSQIENLRLVRNFKNLGFVRSCNRGARLAKGSYLVFLNNDTEVHPGWLRALRQTFAANTKVGLVGAKLVYGDGTLQEAGGIVWSDGSAWNYGRGGDPSLPEFNYVRETDYCSGACLMIPTPLWHELDGFDLRFAPAYCEDSDLAFKVRHAGFKVIYQPGCVVTHHEGKSNGTDIGQGIKRYQVENQLKLKQKWSSVFLRDHFPNAECVFRARERSKNRPIIVFVDHYLPHFDKDAGSRTIWAFVDFFIEAGFSVKFIGDNFFPHQPYQKLLQEKGVEVLTGSAMRENWMKWLEVNGRYIDYFFLSRAHVVMKYLEPIKKTSRAKLLFYGHDLISRTARRQFEVLSDPAKLREAEEWKAYEAAVFEKVDVVYYPSPLEIEEIAQTYPSVKARVIAPYVFKQRLRSVDPTEDDLRQKSGLLFVGGFGHPPNVEAMVWFCDKVVPTLRHRIPNFRLYVAGSNPPEVVRSFSSDDIVVTGFISDAALRSLYHDCRVVVVPLLTGGGIKGKVVEALWHECAVMTTPIGAEGIPNADQVMCVAQPEAFGEALVRLYQDPKRLLELMRCGHAVVRDHYSPAALRQGFLADIIELNSTHAVPV